jgi:hypothetical protein
LLRVRLEIRQRSLRLASWSSIEVAQHHVAPVDPDVRDVSEAKVVVDAQLVFVTIAGQRERVFAGWQEPQ